MNHNESELLKRSSEGQQGTIDVAHYHRFIAAFFEEGVHVEDKNLPVSFDEYLNWKNIFSGWSQGRMTPLSFSLEGRIYNDGAPNEQAL